MTSLGWFNTTATTTATMMALATSSHINPEIINALMMESLRNNLVQACDGERITLHCPKNTQILLENIFYGRLVPSDQLCPWPSKQQLVANEDTTCDVVQAHAKILGQCRNKRKCKIMVKPSFFGADPCPNTSKYLQISYKCKPVSFDDESFCEGSTMQLSCKQNKRLVIHSAHYGRKVEEKAMHCTPNTPIIRDCVINVLGQILYYCHAQTECTVLVDDEHFGKAGCESRMTKYLNLIFMCMSDVIFNEAAIKGNLETMRKIISGLSPTILQKAEMKFMKDDEHKFHIKDDPNLGYKPIQKTFSSEYDKNADVILNSLASSSEESEEEGSFVIAAPNETTLPSGRPFNVFSIIHDIILILRILKDNKEKTLLCLLLSLLAGLTILLIACAISGCCRRRTKQKNSKVIGNKESIRAIRPTKLSTLNAKNHSTSAFLDSHSRISFDVGDLSNNKKSFLRFSQLTPPRIPQNIHGYS
uniref:SUEL-type lectin domain-containing protein n=1 Tax=Onchocerca volvulus TaxID=6282 RepID=A0A8R1XY26_ONCVO